MDPSFARLHNSINQMMGDYRRGGLGLGLGGLASFDPLGDVEFLSWDPLVSGQGLIGSGQQQQQQQQQLQTKGGDDESKMADTAGRSQALTQQRTLLPVLKCRVNIEDKPDVFAVTAEVPGFDKENLTVNISDDHVLTISGEQKKEHVEESQDKRYLRSERSFGSVRRSIRLPKGIDKNAVSANYVNGILHIDIPKKEEAADKTQVQIN